MNTESSGRNTSLNHVQYRNEMASLDPNDPELARKITLINSKYGYGGSQKRRQYNNQSTQGQRSIYHLNRTTQQPNSSYQHTESVNETETPHHSETQHPSETSQFRPKHTRQHIKQRPVSNNYLSNLFSPFFGNLSNVNNLLSRFQSHFENSNGPLNVDSSTDFNPSEAYNTLVNNQNGYTKYVSSFTSFDSSGQKHGATVSGVEKVVNGHKTVSKKIRRFENGVETLEQVFPDGRRVTTTRNLKHNSNRQLIHEETPTNETA